VRPDGDIPENFRARANDHIVFDGWVALDLFKAYPAQGYPMVNCDVGANFSGFADDHAHAVVDEESAADGRTGVDLDACYEPGELADEP